jgi:hypothetical protein
MLFIRETLGQKFGQTVQVGTNKSKKKTNLDKR